MPQRNTRQRRLVLEAVRARMDHPTADEIYHDVRERDAKISRGTVYRNLAILAENGLITHVESEPADRYDLRVDKHYHMRCSVCGTVCDAPVPYSETYDQQVEASTGFSAVRHEMMFEGICAACSKKQAAQA